MTYRSRAGGPLATRRKNKLKPGQPRKLHHPPSNAQRIETEATSVQAALQTPTEEVILDTLRHALDTTLSSPDLRSTIQKIKALLYDAKWLEVFTDEALLEAYAGRWVPSRALCFRELFVHLQEVREFVLGADEVGSEEGDSESVGEDEEAEEDADAEKPERSEGQGSDSAASVQERLESLKIGNEREEGVRVVSLGGGAGSELLAVASLLAYRSSTKGKERQCQWTGADIGKWSSVLSKIDSATRTQLGVSSLSITYTETDLLLPTSPILTQIDPTSPILLTLLFTLTELLSQSPTATITFLRNLSARTAPGSLFLIADSASDIASFSLGSERKWPTFTIIELVLLKMIQGDGGRGAGWELVRGEDSRWFRLGDGVGAGWPVKLENTRYWFRLFRRI